jgi:hypothetical protein
LASNGSGTRAYFGVMGVPSSTLSGYRHILSIIEGFVEEPNTCRFGSFASV